MRNPKWQRDELILALDLYFRFNPSHISNTHPEVIKLSNVLNSLPIHDEYNENDKYRNPNGVYMKLCNFLRLDPTYSGSGLTRGGKLEEIIWDEFANDKQNLNAIAQSIVAGVSSAAPIIFEDDELAFPEGRILYRKHTMRERNKALIKKVKDDANQRGMLNCWICNFDFYEHYGELGKGYIECHHTLPLSEYQHIKNTDPEEIALVCPNCHRMLHIKRPWLKMNELRKLLEKNIKKS